MKKFLNGLGVLGSIILTVILSILIFLDVLILNVKLIVSENGMANTFKEIDIVETLESTENGTVWEDFLQLADTLNLTEEQFEQILNSDKVKEQIGGYIGEVVSSAINNQDATLTKEKVENFFNVAIDEYNKVSDIKISDVERNEIISSFDEEMIANMNEEFSSINLMDAVSPEYVGYVELANNLLYGNYTLIILMIIIIVIGLIALFRFSYYKWMPYVKTSLIISGSLMLIVGVFLLIIPLQDMEIIMPLRKILATRVFITSIILFVLSIGLTFGKKHLKKYVDNKKGSVHLEKNDVINSEKEVDTVEEKKKLNLDKKTIIIIVLVLVLLLLFLFLIFGRKGSYTITFDTNGGTNITSMEVKNNEIVTLPEAPTKDGYKFIGWTNEEGKIITEGTKVTEDLTLKAEWINNDVETVIVEYNADGDNEIDNIIIEKGKRVLLPVEPTKDGFVFVGWVDVNGNLITKDVVVMKDITLKAMWIKKGVKTSTIKYNTDGGSDIGSIIVEKGKVILLPVNPTKNGYVFAGWVDENGSAITKDYIVNKNVTIKATWKKPYNCPSGCTPIGDGSKCTKTSTKEMLTYTGCPSGTETVEIFCSSHQKQVSIGFGEDQFFETAGILCDDNPTGFCVDYNGRYTIVGDSCPSGYYKYTEAEGLGALYGCVKKYDKGGSGCPSGYTKDGSKCTKTETVSCPAN